MLIQQGPRLRQLLSAQKCAYIVDNARDQSKPQKREAPNARRIGKTSNLDNMKKINRTVAVALIVMALMFTSSFMFSVLAQQSYTYLFASSPISSIPPGGPILEPIGATTTPVEALIPATTCGDMPIIDLTHFEKKCRIQSKGICYR